MSPESKQNRIDELLAKAGESLKRNAVFESERMAAKGLGMARQTTRFDRMIAATELLRDARDQRLRIALEIGSVTIFTEPVTDSTRVECGCYLVEPPRVGADARRLRLAAFQNEIPVAVICREPVTRLGLWPVVAVTPGMSVRTKVDPPEDSEQPDLEWFVGAMEALGDWAMASIDPGIDVLRRIDATLERLDAVPEHTGLHELLIELCREAQKTESKNGAASGQRAEKQTEAAGDEGTPRRQGRKRKVQP